MFHGGYQNIPGHAACSHMADQCQIVAFRTSRGEYDRASFGSQAVFPYRVDSFLNFKGWLV